MTIKERILTKPGYKIIAGIIVIVSILNLLSNIDSPYKDVKTGKATLSCQIGDDYKIIDPKKVTGFDDETGYWTFTNGYAKNCDLDYSK